MVKPKSTNFGLGISISKSLPALITIRKLSRLPLQKIQLFLLKNLSQEPNTVSSFLDGRCESVLLRVAANVVGDGKHTIRELVAQKMPIHCEGRDHRSPLEIIKLGDIEQLMLTQQGYAPDDILPEGKKVNLRRNSNISTGGDSIDVTETIDSSYQELAAAMATSMGPGLGG